MAVHSHPVTPVPGDPMLPSILLQAPGMAHRECSYIHAGKRHKNKSFSKTANRTDNQRDRNGAWVRKKEKQKGPEAHSPSTAAPPQQRTQLHFQRDSLFMQTSAPPYAPVPRQQGTLSWSQPHLKYLPKCMPSLAPYKVDEQRGLKHFLPGGQNHANMREQGEQATEGLLPLSMPVQAQLTPVCAFPPDSTFAYQ